MRSFLPLSEYVFKSNKRRALAVIHCIRSSQLFSYRHWYYEDFVREENPKLPSLSLKRFSAMLFKSCPLLTQWGYDHEEAFNTFMQYKIRVPVCGAVMLNSALDKVGAFFCKLPCF